MIRSHVTNYWENKQVGNQNNSLSLQNRNYLKFICLTILKTGFVHTKSLQVDPFVTSSINMLKEHSQMTSHKWGGGYLCDIMCKGLSKIYNF